MASLVATMNINIALNRYRIILHQRTKNGTIVNMSRYREHGDMIEVVLSNALEVMKRDFLESAVVMEWANIIRCFLGTVQGSKKHLTRIMERHLFVKTGLTFGKGIAKRQIYTLGVQKVCLYFLLL